jgi:SNF2 family DNA or RNA helicase
VNVFAPSKALPPLYRFQDEAASAIALAQAPVYNAFEPGLGKTRIAIEVARRLKLRRVLVTCPSSGSLVWPREIAKWWPLHPRVTVIRDPRDAEKAIKFREGVFIVPYGRASQTDDASIGALANASPMEMTVVDEAHFLKNPMSNRSMAIFGKLKGKLGRVHPMSGTPAPNHAGELWSILFNLRPDLIVSPVNGQPMREPEFKARYCEIEHFVSGERRLERVVGSRNVNELRARLSRFFLRETKKNVLKDLPPLSFDVLPIPVSKPRPEIGILGAELAKLDDEAFFRALNAGGAPIAHVHAILGLAKTQGVVDWVNDQLRDNVRRIVVWAVHHDVIDALHLGLFEFGVSKFDGRDSDARRKTAIGDFMSGRHRIFLGQIVAGGTALTLVDDKQPCSDVLFAESVFSPQDNYQAACRVHRIGQRDGVLARFAAAASTFDDRIQAILARKAADFIELFD